MLMPCNRRNDPDKQNNIINNMYANYRKYLKIKAD